MSLGVNERVARAKAAVASAWDAAGLAPALDQPRIVPLDTLVRAFPLFVDEVLKLTRRRAASFLSAQSGQVIAAPEHAADGALAGYLYAYPYQGQVQGCVLIERNDIVERRRFSVAHELGHYLLHFLPRIAAEQRHGQYVHGTEGLAYSGKMGNSEPAVPTGSSTYTREAAARLTISEAEQECMEAEANQFAAELLMPEQACHALLARFGARASARRLATEFLVSPAAMRWRLKDLGMTID